MFAPFSQSLARHFCMDFISDIESGVLFFKQISQISEERKSQGLMVGSLVCYKKNNGERIILHCVSGIAKDVFVKKNPDLLEKTYIKNGLKHIIVNPIVSNEKIEKVLKKNDYLIHKLTNEIEYLKSNSLNNQSQILEAKIQLRKNLCKESLKKVFSLYNFFCADNLKVSLNDIIKQNGEKLPPTGTGDCCAPKLFSYAFSHNLVPISLDEVYFGENTSFKKNGFSYEPCDERCALILPYILGLEILYRDSQIIVVNKPSGLLAVPGKDESKKDCVESRVRRLFPQCIEQPAVHRLDMETSGIMILAFTKEAHKELSRQFMQKEVSKKYEALLDGILENAQGENAPKNGEIKGLLKLKFRLDVENRPYQIYDELNGKEGITEWKKEGTKLYSVPFSNEKKRVTRITFIPHTGRTHQLRLAASSNKGFGMPIIGDSLYGTVLPGERLMLHAKEIVFRHPTSKELMHFQVPPKF